MSPVLSMLITRFIVSFAFGLVLVASVARAADPPPAVDYDAVRQAAKRGLAVAERAARNYPKHRECFSCHHQTLPMQAMAVVQERGMVSDVELLREQTEFALASFNHRLDRLKRGKGIGGNSITVSFGLWSLDIGRHPPDETSDAMITFLLKNQEKDGSWKRASHRPPLQESVITSTVLAVHYMGKFVQKHQQAEVDAATERAKAWLLEAEPTTQEDLNSLVGGLALLSADMKVLRRRIGEILAAQRPDGGWASAPGLESDAYATGQTLFTLERVRLPLTHEAFQRGARFLLETQQPDGSWFVETRAKPIQVFFDNGDPHGKSQFISVAATSWGTVGLALSLPRARRF